jgi:hypothetical protein
MLAFCKSWSSSRSNKHPPGVMGPGVRRDDAERLSPQSPIQFSKSPVVIASEAIQGHAYDSGLLRFARNDGADQDTHLHSRGTKCPSCWKQVALEMTEGAGKAGCPPHPWSACRKKARGRTTGTGGSAFPAQWFYGLYVISPVTILVATVIGETRQHLRQLDACIGAPRPHDFAVRTKRRSSR